ncbi:MAG: hypothetical protein GXP31_02555 [Kiritimatiellaeota bacterium]|nr:hypothetical protein [Kiritimatiellota bacterium]
MFSCRSCLVLFASAFSFSPSLQSATGFSWTDDFNRDSLGPHWQASGFAWTVQDGALRGDWLDSRFAVVSHPRLYRRLTTEVTVTPRAAQGKSWKIAALAVHRDGRNFWHLGLVEAPDKTGKKHFVEFCEMRNGRWLSQQTLEPTGREGGRYAWEYDRAYRLRIVLTPAGIEGSVYDRNGGRGARLGYRFTAPAVALGRPALRVVAMKADFDNFKMQAEGAGVEAPSPPGETAFPPYAVKGSGLPAPGRSTGFFRVLRKGGRWWFADPRNELFYAVGTDHVNYYAHWCQKLGYAPYQRNCEKKYGSIGPWAESSARRLRDWGFNLLGAGNIAEVRHKGLAHTLFASFGTMFAGRSALVEKVHWTGFPNVFDPMWPKYCRARAQELCKPNRNDPWLLGYFLDNELEWYGKDRSETGIFTDTMKWPAGHTGKQALVEFLKEKFDTVQAFNRAWEPDIRAWDDLLAKTKIEAVAAEAHAARRAFVARVADRYFAVATAAVREYDPNHLVIGCRFAGNAPSWVWEACARYCDVVTFNNYPRIDMDSGDLSELAAKFADYYELVKRPMMITEWSFPALDAGLPSKHGAGMRVDTQAQKARCFSLMQHLLFRLPFMVGSDYFMWADEPAQGISDTFPEDSNYGLVNVKDEPYPELTRACRRLNPLAAALHGGRIPETYLIAAGIRAGRLEVSVDNRAAVPASPKILIDMNGTILERTAHVPANGRGQVSVPAGAVPGGQIVRVRLVRDPRTPPGCRGKVDLLTGVYRPGLGWPDSARIRRPLFLLNPGKTPRPSGPVFLEQAFPATRTPTKETVWFAMVNATGVGGEAPAVRLDDGAVAFRAPELPAGGGLAGLLYRGNGNPAGETARSETARVKVERIGETGFRIGNGVLDLRNDGKSGNVVDRISVSGVPLGSYNPLVWQDPGQNQWVRTSQSEGLSIRRLPGGAVLVNVVAAGGKSSRTITAVNGTGQAAARKAAPVRFRVAHRLIVWPGEPWFACRALWVENADPVRRLQIKGVFFYLWPGIGGAAEGDRPGSRLWPAVPNYYRKGGGGFWQDPKAKAVFGATPLAADSRLVVQFWIDNGGGRHPDARIELKPPVELGPGEKRSLPAGDWLLVFGARDTGPEAPDSWSRLRNFVSAASKTVVRLGSVEKRP